MKERKDELKDVSYLDRMKESISVYSWVFRNMVPDKNRKHIKRMLAPMFFYEIFGIAIPFCFGFLADSAAIKKDIEGITFWSIALLISMVVRLVLHVLYMKEREDIKHNNFVELSSVITKSLMKKSIGQHSRHKEELSQSSMNRGREAIKHLTSLMLFQGISSILGLSMSFVFIWILAPAGGAILTVTLGIYIAGSVVINKFVIEGYGPIDDDFKDHNDRLEESWDKAPRIISLGRGLDIVTMLKRDHEMICKNSINFWKTFIERIVLKDLVNVIGLALVWGIYTHEAYVNPIASVSLLVPLFSWSWSTVNNIWRIGHIEQEFNWHLPTVRKLKNALEIKPDIEDKNPSVISFNSTPVVEFRNIHFDHINGEKAKQTIKEISFTINPGDKVALIGMSGAGKSTLANLLQRAADPKSGQVLVNGTDLRDVSLDAWSNLVGEIPQEIEMFQGTLRDNLLMGIHEKDRHLYSDKLLHEAMQDFAIDFCEEEGLDTDIGPKGVRLSGGQKQRVAIVQIALKKTSGIYLIDEATSSLDATTTQAVQKGIRKLLREDKSALIIAHNLSTVRNICNKFIVIRRLEDTPKGESQIEAEGSSFEEIYDQSPTLQRLMKADGLSLNKSDKVHV